MRSFFEYSFALMLFLLSLSIQTEAKRIVVHSAADFSKAEDYTGIKIIVKNDIDLGGSHILLPEKSRIIFRKKGCLRNGVIYGSNTSRL